MPGNLADEHPITIIKRATAAIPAEYLYMIVTVLPEFIWWVAIQRHQYMSSSAG